MMWAAGTAAAAAVVAYWRIVGPGYTWLTASLVASIGFGGWFFDPRPLLLVASGLAVGAVVLARRGVAAALLLGLATVSFLVEAFGSGAPLLALSGSVALGGITAEMLLGHWYLISPQMPVGHCDVSTLRQPLAWALMLCFSCSLAPWRASPGWA